MTKDSFEHRLDGLFSDDFPLPDLESEQQAQTEPVTQESTLPEAEESALPEVEESIQPVVEEPVEPPSVEMFSQEPVSAPASEPESALSEGMLSLEEIVPVVERPLADERPDIQTPPPPERPSSFADEQDLAKWRERILNLLLAGIVIGGAVGIIALVIAIFEKPSRILTYIPYLVAYVFLLVIFFVRRVPNALRIGVLFFAAYLTAVLSIGYNGIMSTGPWYFFAISLLFFVLVGPRAGVISSAVHTLAFISLATAYRVGLLHIVSPIAMHDNSAQFLVVSATFTLVTIVMAMVPWLYIRTQERIRDRLRNQNESLRQAELSSRTREQQLAESNIVLGRQAAHFELGAQVGQLATRALAPEVLISEAVKLVRNQLNLYDASLYLIDDTQEQLVLQAYDHEKSDQIIDHPALFAVASSPRLAKCIQEGQTCIASVGNDEIPSDVKASSDSLLDMELVLPQTRSVAALPLMAQGQGIGVLFLQGQRPDIFGAVGEHQDTLPLQTVADQIAVAISHNRLVIELRERLAEMERLQQVYVREAWEQFLPVLPQTLFQYTDSGVPLLPESELVSLQERMTLSDRASGGDVVLPLSQRGHVIGWLGLQAQEGRSTLTEGEMEMLRAISEQMELILDNARLFEETRRRAAQERVIGEATARMRETLELDTVLQTAVSEISRTLGLAALEIRLGTETTVAGGRRDE